MEYLVYTLSSKPLHHDKWKSSGRENKTILKLYFVRRRSNKIQDLKRRH